MRPAGFLWLLLPSLTIARGTTHKNDHRSRSRSSQNGLRRLRPSPYGHRRVAVDSMEKKQTDKMEAAQKSKRVVTKGYTGHHNNSRAYSSVGQSLHPIGPPMYGHRQVVVNNKEKKDPLIFNSTQKNTRVLSDLYTGFLNNTFPVPLYLKSSTLVNSLSGLTTFGLRPTLLLGGAALLGASGILFLSNLQTEPSNFLADLIPDTLPFGSSSNSLAALIPAGLPFSSSLTSPSRFTTKTEWTEPYQEVELPDLEDLLTTDDPHQVAVARVPTTLYRQDTAEQWETQVELPATPGPPYYNNLMELLLMGEDNRRLHEARRQQEDRSSWQEYSRK